MDNLLVRVRQSIWPLVEAADLNDVVFPAEAAAYLIAKSLPQFHVPAVLKHSWSWTERAVQRVETAAQHDPQFAARLMALEGRLRAALR